MHGLARHADATGLIRTTLYREDTQRQAQRMFAMYFDLLDSILYPAVLQFETPNARRCIS